MKTVYLMRHAKSSWEFSELDDFDRPLIGKGEERTMKILSFLIDKHVLPDLIVSSPATRAFETAKIMAGGMKMLVSEIQIDKSIYGAGIDTLESVIYSLPSSVNTVLIVGHNPGMTDLANHFMERKVEFLPTSAVVGLEFPVEDWTQLDSGKPVLKFMIFPKMLEKKEKE